MFLKTKIATGAVAGVLTLAMTGAAAFAGSQPAEPLVSSSVHESATDASASERGKNTGLVRALEAILGRLVENGTITAEQQTQILAAVGSAAAAEDGHRHLKRVWSRFMAMSMAYLDLTKAEVNAALRAGTSLGALAAATEGKSREGLIGAIAAGATALIDQAVEDGKITREQAAAAEAELLDKVTAFVDHVYERKAPADRARELKERAKERIKDLRERFKERRAERRAERGDGQDQDD